MNAISPRNGPCCFLARLPNYYLAQFFSRGRFCGSISRALRCRGRKSIGSIGCRSTRSAHSSFFYSRRSSATTGIIGAATEFAGCGRVTSPIIPRLNLTLGNAYRFGWTAVWTGSRFFYFPAVLFGFHVHAVFEVLGLNLLYQFWLHNEWMPKLGWIEYVFNTPSHHRVHHAANVEYLDANYGGILIVFDRMFGTFIEERADLPCEYGLVKQVKSQNPLITSFHEWWCLGRDLRSARSLESVVGFLLGAPGWRPGPGESDHRRSP